MAEALQYCEQLVREADKDRFLATLFAAAPLRGALYALYAFDLEIAQIRDRISTPLPGEVRLQWWRDVLTATAAGEPGANPVAEALRDTIVRHELPVTVFLGLIDARTFDLYDDPMATLVEFDGYARATAGAMMALATHILNGGPAPECDEAIRHAGSAMTLTAALIHVPLHASRGQCFLPADILAARGVDLADLFAGRASDALNGALADLRAIVRGHLDALRSIASEIPPKLLPAFLPLALAPASLRQMERAGADPFRPQPVPQWRRQWILWRAARRPARFLG
jgi:phytoene synthase